MNVLLSIKPKYADKIFAGVKIYEFRKIIFKNKNVKKVIVYASAPVCKVIGEFEIESILSLNTKELWQKTMHESGIDKEFYDDYFSGKRIGHAIKVKKVRKYPRGINIDHFSIKRPPQSFTYIK